MIILFGHFLIVKLHSSLESLYRMIALFGVNTGRQEYASALIASALKEFKNRMWASDL